MLVRTNAIGAMTKVPLSAEASPAYGITVGPDGALWFTQALTGTIGRVADDGSITEFPLPMFDGTTPSPVGIATGPDGNLWVTLFGDGIARVTPGGAVTEFGVGVDAGALRPSLLTAGPDGNIWFSAVALPFINRITPAGVVTHFAVSGRTLGVAAGPDGTVWFAMPPMLGRITFDPDPSITEYNAPGMLPAEMVPGPDCASLYVADTQGNRVRRFSPPATDAGPDAAISFIDFDLPTPSADVESLAIGPGGSEWFVEVQAAREGFFQP